jgi:DNA-binding transcriptional MerR regulator
MGEERRREMTQAELLTEMHKLGCNNVTERQLADWRRKDLLPPFDVMGGGQGQGRGRERSSWTNGESVLDQALWVRELMQIYRSMESVRLPLWVLGYPVPLKRVREALGGPLNEIANDIADAIENEARASGEIEDMIEEVTFYHVEEMRREGAKALPLPQHSLEAFINIFLNQDYDLTDGAFELGIEELREYEAALRQRQDAALAAEGFGDADPARQDDSLLKFIERAPFIKQYFSLHQLKQAVDECTDGDLRAVQRDLSYLRGMALLLCKIITILTREIPAEYHPSRADNLQPILSAAGLVILADLSLRRHGFAREIDYFLPEALRRFQQQFTEEMERELVEASKQIPEIIETCIPIIVNTFLQESQAG